MARAFCEVSPTRIAEMGSRSMPLRLAAMFYEQIALATLCFVAQLVPPPADIRRDEERLLASLMRVPYRSIPWAAWFCMRCAGGPRIKSAESPLARSAFASLGALSRNEAGCTDGCAMQSARRGR